MFTFFVAVLVGASVCSAGEVLHNGIVLPDKWPPGRTAEELGKGEVMPVPYLKSPPEVVSIDVGRQLFVDDFLIESSTLKREFHLAEIYEHNPVLKADQPWENEGAGPMAMPFSDGVFFDPKDQLFKMWYMAGYGKQTAYATSRDGLHWEKPVLDVKSGTNIVQKDPRDSSAVWLDLEDRDPNRRFKMWRSVIVEKKWCLTAHFSPDGIHWSEPVAHTGPAGDRSTVFWNPFRKVWVYSMRAAVPGSQRTRTYWEVKDVAAGPYWTNQKDLAHWVGSDRLDPPREDLQVTPQLYNLDATAYESLMVGLFAVWRGDKNIPPGRPKPNSIWLGFSRDGFHWDRPDRHAFIPVSEKQGDWNWGNVQSAGGGFLVVGDKLWFYFSGRSGLAGKRDGGGATGLAFLRRDGFASMNATGGEGTLTTRHLKFSGAHLFVNVAAAAGELCTEVLDRDGKVIAPFSKENCLPVSVDKTLAAVTWKDAGDLSKLAGQPVRLRFHLRNGALYAFWISPETSGASHGYVAAGGPGFTGPTDTVGTTGAH